MQQLNRVSALAAAFLLAASAAFAQDQPPIGLAPPDLEKAVYVSGAGGQTRVPVRIIMARQSLLSATRKGTWSGDTLFTRTPLALDVAAGTPSVIFQAVRDGVIRVTLGSPPDAVPETAAGSEVMLQLSRGRRSLSVREHANARIARIENDIIAIDASGADSGAAQSLLSRMATLNVPGLSIAVFDSGRMVLARGYGVSDQNTGTVVDTATLFQAASISKPVTSVAMFRLVEQGRMSLDEDVNARLQSWAVPNSPFTQVEKVTPRRIVTHMSGLSVHGFLGYRPDEAVPTLQQVLNGEPPANSPSVGVDTIPGTRERYSGGGFVVLQLLMQEVADQSFDSLLADLVLRPAGMVHSTLAQPLPAELGDRAATGHDHTGAPIVGKYHVHPELAAAGLWSTPSDLARFMLAVGRSYRGEPGGLLELTSARTMLTAVPGGSGQGFGLSGEGDAFRYRHSGGNAGFTCYAVAFAGIGRGMVVMTNSDAGSQLIRELTRSVAREYGWPRMWVRE